MYAPSKEQAEEDRARAYEAGVPHGERACAPPAARGVRPAAAEPSSQPRPRRPCWPAPAGYVAPGDRFKDLPTIELLVVSDLVRGARLLGLALPRC
jgi:hypothetical protein